mmetsp:Transcript_2735/g.3156  ORF Transcript_2735/g.3156 Transcript_2735/m.3156 type:complete len:139 (+) Transcript_2735:62-478(+)
MILAFICFAFITNGSIVPVTPYLRPLATAHRQYDRLLHHNHNRQPSERINSNEEARTTRFLSNDDADEDDGDEEAYYNSKYVHFNYDYSHTDGASTITLNENKQFVVSDDYHYWQWWVWALVVILSVASLWCIRKCLC